jgi:hypothetical protein
MRSGFCEGILGEGEIDEHQRIDEDV